MKKLEVFKMTMEQFKNNKALKCMFIHAGGKVLENFAVVFMNGHELYVREDIANDDIRVFCEMADYKGYTDDKEMNDKFDYVCNKYGEAAATTLTDAFLIRRAQVQAEKTKLENITDLLNEEQHRQFEEIVYGENGIVKMIPAWTKFDDEALECICILILLQGEYDLKSIGKNILYGLYADEVEGISREYNGPCCGYFTKKTFFQFMNTYFPDWGM